MFDSKHDPAQYTQFMSGSFAGCMVRSTTLASTDRETMRKVAIVKHWVTDDVMLRWKNEITMLLSTVVISERRAHMAGSSCYSPPPFISRLTRSL